QCPNKNRRQKTMSPSYDEPRQLAGRFKAAGLNLSGDVTTTKLLNAIMSNPIWADRDSVHPRRDPVLYPLTLRPSSPLVPVIRTVARMANFNPSQVTTIINQITGTPVIGNIGWQENPHSEFSRLVLPASSPLVYPVVCTLAQIANKVDISETGSWLNLSY